MHISSLIFLFSLFREGSLRYATPGCPGGFQLLNDYTCVKLITDKANYQDASRNCRSLDKKSTLVAVRNSIDNRRLAELAASLKQPVWIGLQCNSPIGLSNCYWDDTRDGATSYSNFAPGNPSVPEPVAMVPFGANAGRWYSADGDRTMNPYFCETRAVDVCENAFGYFCYTFFATRLQWSDAQKVCESACGNLVSIHSDTENDYVTSMSRTIYSSGDYFHLGATTLPKNSWVDGSSWDYDNFGYLNTDIGSHLAFASTREAAVNLGKWISVDDQAVLPFVCKIYYRQQCGPTLAPTVAPSGCDGARFFTGNGTIYSPNYPYSYAGNSTECMYVITAHANFHPNILFTEFVLDASATIEVYDRIETDANLIVVLSSKNPPTGVIQSDTNLLRLVFKRMVLDYPVDFEWKASYSYGN